jgi:RHH-type proline utilization regulon transcriptional repressor/proline dehydrogenase/delta 1-pyrroline-5-carboxylate dehydrogenase
VNSTGYGLTSALESLNEDEQLLWKNSIQAGNLYINRSSTGAVVERQPFGGMNKSAFGIGIKAGGLNYIYQFFNFENSSKTTSYNTSCDIKTDGYNLKNVTQDMAKEDRLNILPTFQNYIGSYNSFFSKEIDYQKIPGQSNVTRFLQLPDLAIRADSSASIKDLILAILAAKLCVKEVGVSLENENLLIEIEKISPAILWHTTVTTEKNEDFLLRMERFKRVRFVGSRESESLKNHAAKSGMAVISESVVYQGRIELLNYLQEQSVSNNYHRFGYIAQSPESFES